ncbi:MAG: DUF58 domain-containing protein [Longimicrobiales bacterium]
MIRRLRRLLGRAARRGGPAPSPSRERPGLPEASELALESRRLGARVGAGFARSLVRGNGPEVDRIRGYQHGDEARAVDWKVTARRGELHVRESRQEREADVLIVLDRSPDLFAATDRRAARAALVVAATLAEAAAAPGYRVGLVQTAADVHVVMPGSGRHHGARIRAALLDPALADGAPVRGSARALFEHAARVVPRPSTVVIVSSFHQVDPDAVRSALIRLASVHDVVPVVVRTPGVDDLPSVGRVRVREADTGALTVVDTSSEAVRETVRRHRLDEAERRRALFAPVGLEPVSIHPLHDLAPPLLARWGGRGGGAAVRGAVRRVGAVIAALALSATLPAVGVPALSAQVASGLRDAPAGFVLETDTVVPDPVRAGRPAFRTVVFSVPDGVRVTWPPSGRGGDADVVGVPRVHREPAGGGRVRWTLAYPVTAWRGVASTGALPLRLDPGGGWTLPPRSLAVADEDLPADAEPAPALAAVPPPDQGALAGVAVVSLLVGLACAGAWWQGGRPLAALPDPVARPASPAEVRVLLEQAARAADAGDPSSVRYLADGVRGVAGLGSEPVGPATSTEEVLALLGTRPVPFDAVAGALRHADAVRYGGRRPDVAGTGVRARSLLEAWSDA